VVKIQRDKYLTIRISEKMLNDFQKALDKTEHSKSEVVRDCVRKFIEKNK
jgi:metal-responsive CopG/Arc/MetJ family transcriptional regulator